MTGSEGRIGRAQVGVLREAGHEVRTFDRFARRERDGEHVAGDLRDISVVRNALRGMDAVLHLGAVPSDRRGHEDDVLSTNVQGTWNVLLACVETGTERVVYYSSVNALGCVGGHKPADRFPIADDYPRHPQSAYQLSKHLAEEACRSFSDKHGLAVVSLRPVYVAAPDKYGAEGSDARADWQRSEYWAYVDLRDVVEAGRLALSADVGCDAFLLTADDTSVNVPTAELVDRYYPDTPWPAVSKNAYLDNAPFRSLFDCSHAKNVLGWQPQHSWRGSI